MREPRNALLGNIGGSIASPLVDDRAYIVLLGFSGNRMDQLIREPHVEFDEIDLFVRQRIDDPRHLILRRNGHRECRPHRICAIENRPNTIDARPEHQSRPDGRPELQHERFHIAGVHHGGHARVQQGVQVFLISENIESNAVRPTEQMHVHVRKTRDQRPTLAIETPAARRHVHRRRCANGDDPLAVDDDGSMLNRHAAVAVDDPDIGNGERIRARPIRRQSQQRDADIPTDFSCRGIQNRGALAVHGAFPLRLCFSSSERGWDERRPDRLRDDSYNRRLP